MTTHAPSVETLNVLDETLPACARITEHPIKIALETYRSQEGECHFSARDGLPNSPNAHERPKCKYTKTEFDEHDKPIKHLCLYKHI